jgi:hypothetical protein
LVTVDSFTIVLQNRLILYNSNNDWMIFLFSEVHDLLILHNFDAAPTPEKKMLRLRLRLLCVGLYRYIVKFKK